MFSDYDRARHSVTKLQVRLIFTTKYRRKVMKREVLERVLAALRAAADDLECTLLEVNGEADHVHLLVSYPPKNSVSEMVNVFKTKSSRMIRKEFPGILEGGKTGLFWSRSYFACSVGGASLEVLKKYIENQKAD